MRLEKTIYKAKDLQLLVHFLRWIITGLEREVNESDGVTSGKIK